MKQLEQCHDNATIFLNYVLLSLDVMSAVADILTQHSKSDIAVKFETRTFNSVKVGVCDDVKMPSRSMDDLELLTFIII